MMSARHITHNSRTYTFCPSSMAPAAHRVRAVMQARLVDELTGLGLTGNVQIKSTVVDLSSRIVGSGVVGLVANPARRFTDLVANAATIDLEFTASRYLSRNLEISLGPLNTGVGTPADFPAYFLPVNLGDILMHRAGVRLAGHAMLEIGSSRTALTGVDVSISGIWSTEPGPDDDADLLIEAPDILSLAPGLYRERLAATNTLRSLSFNMLAPPKRLLLPANSGATTLRVSDQISLAVGDLLALTPNDPNTAEFIQIAAIDGGLTANEPASVTLEYPVAIARRLDTEVFAATVAAGPGLPAPFTRDGIPGDVTIHLAAIPATLSDSSSVEISGDGVPEYQVARRYVTQTNADGHYRLPPLSRVARLTLEANRGDFAAPLAVTIGPDYEAGSQQLDFLLRS